MVAMMEKRTLEIERLFLIGLSLMKSELFQLVWNSEAFKQEMHKPRRTDQQELNIL
jgi:hypothetical protein